MPWGGWRDYGNNNKAGAWFPPYRDPLSPAYSSGAAPPAAPRSSDWRKLEDLRRAVQAEVAQRTKWDGGLGIAIGPPVQGQNLPTEVSQPDPPGAATPDGTNSEGLVRTYNSSRNTHFDLWVNGPTEKKHRGACGEAGSRWVRVGRFTVADMVKMKPDKLADNVSKAPWFR